MLVVECRANYATGLSYPKSFGVTVVSWPKLYLLRTETIATKRSKITYQIATHCLLLPACRHINFAEVVNFSRSCRSPMELFHKSIKLEKILSSYKLCLAQMDFEAKYHAVCTGLHRFSA